LHIIAGVPESPRPRTVIPIKEPTTPGDDEMICDRRSAEMYRLHAVRRWPACGFKTDCGGW
jgi:hypothetical protein